jgi:hypothetical protein
LAVALVAAAIALLFIGGGDDDGTATPTGATSTPTGGSVAAVCADIPPDLVMRTDSFQRTATAVRTDADALETAGDTENAAKANELADILDALAEANEAQEDTSALLGDLNDQLDALGC